MLGDRPLCFARAASAAAAGEAAAKDRWRLQVFWWLKMKLSVMRHCGNQLQAMIVPLAEWLRSQSRPQRRRRKNRLPRVARFGLDVNVNVRCVRRFVDAWITLKTPDLSGNAIQTVKSIGREKGHHPSAKLHFDAAGRRLGFRVETVSAR